ncbi:MAG: hypothetical protein SGI77_03995 [Pirellulaceae bacterium]|nr:hypothetical protein [Pirellulaceae bacterium]
MADVSGGAGDGKRVVTFFHVMETMAVRGVVDWGLLAMPIVFLAPTLAGLRTDARELDECFSTKLTHRGSVLDNECLMFLLANGK